MKIAYIAFIINSIAQYIIMQTKKPKKVKHKYKSLGKLIGLTLNCGLSAFYYGFCLTYFNSIPFRNIISIYHIEQYPKAATEGLLTGCISFMGAFGSIMALFFVDRFSRKKCLLFFSYCAVVLSLLLMIPHIWILIAVRCIQGLIIGAISCITPLYINEMMPKSVSGPFWSFHQFLYVFGITFSFILSLVCSNMFQPALSWRIVFGFPIVTAAIQIFNFVYIFPYQSPKFLIIHDREEEARTTLKYLYEDKYVEKILKEIIEAIEYAEESSSDDQSSKVENNDIMVPLRKSFKKGSDIELKEFKKNHQKFSSKFSLKQSLLKVNQQEQEGSHNCANNKIALFAAVFLSAQQPFLGGPSVIQYSGDLIEGVFPQLESIFPIIINATGIIGSLLAICVTSKFGRRDIILFGSFSEACFLFLLFILCYFIDYNDTQKAPMPLRVIASALFILVRLVLSSTFSPVNDLYSAQIVQPNILPICSLFQWIMMGVVSSFFPIISSWKDGNPFYAFGIFFFITLISFFIDKVIIIETKNKTQIEIRKQYDEKFPN